MATPTERIQQFLGKHEHGGRSHVTHHVAEPVEGVVMVFLDCRQCGAGSGTSMPEQDATAIAWPGRARAR